MEEIPGLGREVEQILRRTRGLFDLSGRVALVVGGASGLGLAIAAGLAAHGAAVAVADRDREGAEAVATALAGEAGGAIASHLDVLDGPSIATAIEAVLDWGGKLDVAFNVAGINDRRSALDLDVESFKRVLAVDLIGLYACSRAIGARMVAAGGGSLVNVASIFGHVAAPNQAAYAASKGGVLQLTKVLAQEWAPHGVRVNALSPAHVRTPLAAPVLDDPDLGAWVRSRIARGEPGEPWEIVGPAVFLAAEASSFITGASLVVDGGWLAG